jgi:hypothetical protein
MLGTFGIESPGFMSRAAHQEFATRDTDHLGAFRALIELAGRLGLATKQDGGGQYRDDAKLHGAHQSRNGAAGKPLGPEGKDRFMIRKLASGKYRLYSRKKNPKTGKRRNLGTFDSRKAAEKHERAVQYFKRH